MPHQFFRTHPVRITIVLFELIFISLRKKLKTGIFEFQYDHSVAVLEGLKWGYYYIDIPIIIFIYIKYIRVV